LPYSFVFFKGMPKWLLRGYLLSYCVTMHFLLAEKQSALLGSINFHSYTHIIWSRCLLMFYLNNWLVHEVKFAVGQCHKRQMTRSWRSKHHNINFLFYFTGDGTEMRCSSCQSLRIPYDDSFSFFDGSVYFQNPVLHPVSPPYMYALFSICYRFQFSSAELSGVHVYTYILYWVCPCIHDRMTMRIVYSREFLLSFGELEHCKKLPPDFDTPLLRSFRLVFYCLGLFPSGQWDFCLTIFVFQFLCMTYLH